MSDFPEIVTDRLESEIHASACAVHDLSTGLRGLARIAAHALEQPATGQELALMELEVLAGLLAEKATETATDLEPLEFAKRLQAEAEASHDE